MDLEISGKSQNLSNLNAGILIMMQQVRLMMFSLNMVDYFLPLAVNLSFFGGQVGGTILNLSYSLTLDVGPFFHA